MISDYIPYLLLGPRMAQGLNALQALGNIPALLRLYADLSSIESGNRIPIGDDEIREGMDELKALLDANVESRQDLDDRLKMLAKQGNGYVVSGLYNDVVAFLLQRGYRVKVKENRHLANTSF